VNTLTDPVTGDQMVDVLATIAPELLNQKCLDHGFVKILDCMPRLVPLPKVDGGGPNDNGVPSCDFAIADAARISYQKGTRKVSADAGLIDHLIRNQHTSPIEMGELKFHIRLPIFVMRQHVRHRTASLNEESARYSELASDFYIPDAKDWALNTAADKQATVKYSISPLQAQCLHDMLKKHNDLSYSLYQQFLEGSLDGELGDSRYGGSSNAQPFNGQSPLDQLLAKVPIAREQARAVLGVNIYTQCVWKIDLKNMLHYLKLRTDKHAQYEIRVFADAMARVVDALFPRSWESHKDNFIDGVNFSGKELIVLNGILNGFELNAVTSSGWTKRRFDEFAGKLRRSKLVSDEKIVNIIHEVWPSAV